MNDTIVSPFEEKIIDKIGSDIISKYLITMVTSTALPMTAAPIAGSIQSSGGQATSQQPQLRRARSLVSRIFFCGANTTNNRPSSPDPQPTYRTNPHRRSTGQQTNGHSIRKAFQISALTLLVNVKRDTVKWTNDELSFTIDTLNRAKVNVMNLKKGSVVREWSVESGLNQQLNVKLAKPGIYSIKLCAEANPPDPTIAGIQRTDIELSRTASGGMTTRMVSQTVQIDNGTNYSLLEIYGRPSTHHSHSQSSDAVGLSAQVNTASAEGQNVAECKECIICLANDRDTIVLPCRHLCLCAQCAENLRSRVDKCPICRECCQGLLQVKQAEEIENGS